MQSKPGLPICVAMYIYGFLKEGSKIMTNELDIEFEFWFLYTMICISLNVTSLIAQRCRCLFYVFGK